MRIVSALVLCLAVSMLAVPPASGQLGGVLDRVKRKTGEAAAETRELKDSVQSVTEADERAQAEAAQTRGQAEQAAPTAGNIERRSESEVASSAPATASRDLQSEVDRIATTDDRAVAEARGEVASTRQQVEAAADVEGRARRDLEQTRPVAEAREIDRDTRNVTSTDDRVQAEIDGDVGGIEGDVRAIEGDLDEIQDSVREAGSLAR